MEVRALQGDTLDELCYRHLGTTAGVVERALDENQGLAAIGMVLPVGTIVTLPDAAPAPATKEVVQLWD